MDNEFLQSNLLCKGITDIRVIYKVPFLTVLYVSFIYIEDADKLALRFYCRCHMAYSDKRNRGTKSSSLKMCHCDFPP